VGRAPFLLIPLTLAANYPPVISSPEIAQRSVQIQIDDAGGSNWRTWCGGLLVAARDPSSELQVLTASHCVTDLAGEQHRRARMRVLRADGESVFTPDQVAALASGRQPRAIVMDYAFISLARTIAGSTGVPLDIRPRALEPREPVFVRSAYGEHVCRVAYTCGTQIELNSCDPAIVPGVSGSSAWVVRGGRPLVGGVITQGEPLVRTATMTSYTAVLAKSSFLVADPRVRDHDLARSAFVARYLGKAGYRLPRDANAPHCQASAESLLMATALPVRDTHMFVGAAFGPSGELTSWDRSQHQLCDVLPDQPPVCTYVDLADHGRESIRGVTFLSGQDYLLRFDHGGALVVRRNSGGVGWTILRSVAATSDPASKPSMPLKSLTNAVEGGFATSVGELILFGEGGLCVVEGSSCRLVVRPGAHPRGDSSFTVRSAFEASPGRIIAVGRDFGGQDKPRCVIYERTTSGWSLTRFCGGLDLQLHGLNAAIPLRDGALIFSSSGAALFVGPSLVAKRLAVTGLLMTPIGAPQEFDDAVRVAGWIVPGKIVAIAGSDGAVHVLKVETDAQGLPALRTDRCVWKSDLGLWLLAMDVQPDRAAIVSQGGELNYLSWKGPKTLERFFDKPFDGQCS
jgi:hypothetical protein